MAIVIKNVDISVTDSKLELFMAADREKGWRLIEQRPGESWRYRCHNVYEVPEG